MWRCAAQIGRDFQALSGSETDGPRGDQFERLSVTFRPRILWRGFSWCGGLLASLRLCGGSGSRLDEIRARISQHRTRAGLASSGTTQPTRGRFQGLRNRSFRCAVAREQRRSQGTTALAGNPSAARCADHSSGSRVSAMSALAVSSGGCRPSRIAATMSGARPVKRRSRPA